MPAAQPDRDSASAWRLATLERIKAIEPRPTVRHKDKERSAIFSWQLNDDGRNRHRDGSGRTRHRRNFRRVASGAREDANRSHLNAVLAGSDDQAKRRGRYVFVLVHASETDINE